MNSVYVLIGGHDYDGDEVLGAYSTLEAATAAMDKHAGGEWWQRRDRYSVMRCVVDADDEPSRSAWRRTKP